MLSESLCSIVKVSVTVDCPSGQDEETAYGYGILPQISAVG